MYSYSDFECLYVRYQMDGAPSGISIEKFRLANKVPYNLFHKWYKDTRNRIVPVQVLDTPSTDSPTAPPVQQASQATPPLLHTGLRIMVDIRMGNGVHIEQKNLSYDGLKYV